MQPEKFQSKYEPRSNVMDIQVGEGAQGLSGPSEVPAPGHAVDMIILVVPPLAF